MTGRSCRICGNQADNSCHFPREMLFGWREEFEYLECARCGCLQIARIPADLAKYYPAHGYYSYKAPKIKRYPAWLRGLRRERTRYRLGERSALGALLDSVSKSAEHFAWFRSRGVSLDSLRTTLPSQR